VNTELQSEERKETLAAEADGRISGSAHWNDWMYIADGFAVGVAKAMRAANTNRPYGKAYTRLFGEWLEERPWAKRYDKGTRSNLLWCADHRSEIEEWRSTLNVEVRNKLNHPTNFRRKYEAAHRKAEAPDEPKKENVKDNLLRENEELRAKFEAMKRDGGSLFDLQETAAATIADVIASELITAGRFTKLLTIQSAIAKRIAEHKAAVKSKAQAG
jgi:hypothetical protein